jgi:hypothetical protein
VQHGGSARISQDGIAVVDTESGTVSTVGHGYPCGVSFAPSGTLRLVFGLGGRTTGCDPGTSMSSA